MMKRDYHYFEIAKAVSHMSDYKRCKIGAVVVRKNKILGMGMNLEKTHPIQQRLNELTMGKKKHDFIHAEVNAIRHVPDKSDLKGSSIYIYRELKDGSLALCRPCPACLYEIRKYGIKKMFYTTYNGFCEENLI